MITEPRVLVGQRVTLRPYNAGFTDEELRRVFAWARDGEVLTLSGGTPLEMSFERFRELFAAQLPRHNSESEHLFVILDESGVLIGRAGLFGLNRRSEPRTAELGIVIGEHDRWGHGYGRDAVRALVAFAFDSLGLDRVRLYTYPENVRARRAFEAAGFRELRELRRFSFDRGTHSEIEMENRPPALL